MNTGTLTVVMMCVICTLLLVLARVRHVDASQVGLAPYTEQLRFQLIGNEPIAGPDGRALVNEWSVLMFKDRKSNECYLAFSRGWAIAAVNVTACPQPSLEKP
jgi:hypothetical protein